MTPMLKQYYDLKTRCEDAILFFRMGDFYEIFGEDAQQVAPRLELVLTSRERGDNERIPFCGVPHHSARNYWLRLLKQGFKVAIADQVEDPKQAKGLVKREVTRVFTPGCIEDLEGLDSERPNFLMAVFEVPTKGRSALVGQKQWTLAIADISTGELRVGNVDDEREIQSLAERMSPREVLVRKFDEKDMQTRLESYRRNSPVVFSFLPEAILRDEMAQREVLHEVFGQTKLASQPCGKVVGGEALVAALLTHYKNLFAPIRSFLAIRPLQDPDTLVLGETVLRDLEIYESSRRRDTKGSLFSELNRCLTSGGARRLRREMCFPLTKKEVVEKRRSWVRAFLGLEATQKQGLVEILTGVPDAERLATRVLSGYIHPGEVGQLRLAIERAGALASWLQRDSHGDLQTRRRWIDTFEAVAELGQYLRRALEEAPVPLGNGTGVFRAGFDRSLDGLNKKAHGGQEIVANYEAALRERTGISSLKIRPHQTFGLLIEVTKAHAGKAPADFIRRQTMVNGERFVTAELQKMDQELSSAQEAATGRERELFVELLSKISESILPLRAVAESFAELDFLFCLAVSAQEGGWCAPEVSVDELQLQGSRHPVVERFVGRHSFAANDLRLNRQQSLLLLTGPNMGGKSTLMRQVAIAAILNQIGAYVPARVAKLPLFDRIFTRVGAGDDLASGHSTFMVEMAETAVILRQATARSLVILDEVGRGTSTTDGLALASAILTEIASRTKALTLFATHYHELVDVAAKTKGVSLGQMEVLEKSGNIQFTHRLIDGAAESSFGLEVARLAGLPDGVLAQARKNLESGSISTRRLEGAMAEQKAPAPLETAGLKAKEPTDRTVRIVERLSAIRIHSTTPLQALNILDELKGMAATVEQGSLFQ